MGLIPKGALEGRKAISCPDTSLSGTRGVGTGSNADPGLGGTRSRGLTHGIRRARAFLSARISHGAPSLRGHCHVPALPFTTQPFWHPASPVHLSCCTGEHTERWHPGSPDWAKGTGPQGHGRHHTLVSCLTPSWICPVHLSPGHAWREIMVDGCRVLSEPLDVGRPGGLSRLPTGPG